jgi:hypothetical protein
MQLNKKSIAGRFIVEIQKIWWQLTNDDEYVTWEEMHEKSGDRGFVVISGDAGTNPKVEIQSKWSKSEFKENSLQRINPKLHELVSEVVFGATHHNITLTNYHVLEFTSKFFTVQNNEIVLKSNLSAMDLDWLNELLRKSDLNQNQLKELLTPYLTQP